MAQKKSLGEVQQVTSEVEQKYGLPEGTLFKISGIESSHGVNMLSPKGAKGWFGFTDKTAKAYGLDDPHDLVKSADAAGRYMKDNLQRFEGNMDMALADYNGGTKAVKALAAGKPWPETVDYLTKFHGKEYQVGGTFRPNKQFTTAQEARVTTSASGTDLVAQQAKDDAEYGGFWNTAAHFPGLVADAWKQDNSIYNHIQQQGIEQTDPDFEWTKDKLDTYLDPVPMEHWDYIKQAKSEKEAQLRLGRVQESLANMQKMAKWGMGANLSAGLIAGLADVPTLLAFVAPEAAPVAMLSKASRISNAVRIGLASAGTNVAYDSWANQARPLSQPEDLYISAAMGLGIGALSGLATNPAKIGARQFAKEQERLANYGFREANRGMLKDIEDSGVPLTPKGEEFKKALEAPIPEAPAPRDPGIAIIHPPEEPAAPPKIFQGERPVEPKPRVEEPAAPKETFTSGKPWGDSWNTPKFTTKDDAGRELLVLPKVARVSQMADYIRLHSKNEDLKMVMNRVLKGIDLRKLEFKVLEQGEKFGIKEIDRAAQGSRGAVLTPNNSVGDGIKMFLRGHTWADNGMNEETFVHELVHAAAVYKQQQGISGIRPGVTASKEILQANAGMKKLLIEITEHARSTFGDSWREHLNGRLGINLSNDRELLAYGLTNRAFQDYLKSVKVSGGQDRTLWDRFVFSLRRLLGLGEKEHNALSRLIELSQPLTKKGGVTRKTSDLLDATGIVDSETVKAANEAELSPVFGYGLGLEHRLGSDKVPQGVRQLASKLFGSTVGYKNHAVVNESAWDTTLKLAESWTAELKKTTNAELESWFSENGIKWHQKAKAADDFMEMVSDYIRGAKGDYPKQVVNTGEMMRKKLSDAVDYLNNPLKDEGGSKRGLTTTELRDPETGEVKIVGELEKNPYYLPRKADVTKWNNMVAKFGREAVEGWWAAAHKAVRPEISDEQAAKFGKWYVNTIEESIQNRSQDLLNDMLRGQDKEALLKSLVENGGFSEAEARQLMDDMLPTKATDTGRLNASLKHRNSIDENFTQTWKLPDGSTVKVGIKDFTNANALDLVENYLRRTAGSVALAKHLDVYKTGQIDQLVADATRIQLGDKTPKVDTAKYRDDLKFVFDRIMGIPQERFTVFNKSMEMWRNFNVIRLMGGAVWNQATELAQIVGTMGWKATLSAVTELRSLRRDIATGKAPHEILDYLENTIGGSGAEYVTRLEFSAADDWVRHAGDSAMNRNLDRLDNGLKKFAQGVLAYTGMTPLMIQQKRIHAIALVNHFIDHANGKRVSTFLTKDRLAWMGLDEAAAQKVFDGLKTFSSTAKGEFSKERFKVDFAGWAKADPESHSKFMTAIHRETRRVIQENDLASMVPIMGTTLGKTVFQFMNFSIHGWNKSMLFAMNHRDWSTLSTVLQGSLIASLAYMGRTYSQAIGMDEEKRKEFLDKRMSTKQIVANSFGRISQASLLPSIVDTVSPVPMFSGMRTTSDLSSLASNPTYQALNGLISTKKLIRNGMSDEYQTTEQDIRTWSRLVPLNNTVLMSGFLNSLANDFPSSEREQ